MKNIDKIKQMNSNEISKILNSNKCNMCTYNNTNCMKEFCHEGTKAWLEQESELTLKEIVEEFNEFCRQGKCLSCNPSDHYSCYHNFLIDHFNINDGKITRRMERKYNSRI